MPSATFPLLCSMAMSLQNCAKMPISWAGVFAAFCASVSQGVDGAGDDGPSPGNLLDHWINPSNWNDMLEMALQSRCLTKWVDMNDGCRDALPIYCMVMLVALVLCCCCCCLRCR